MIAGLTAVVLVASLNAQPSRRISAEEQYRRGAEALAHCGASSTDCPEAITALQDAADRGVVAAEFLLAQCLDLGRGVARDRTAAFHAFHRAASAGHPGAAFALGVRYRDGSTGQADLVESYKWFAIACERWSAGDADAAQVNYRQSRDEAAGRLTDAQLAGASTPCANGSRSSRRTAPRRSPARP